MRSPSIDTFQNSAEVVGSRAERGFAPETWQVRAGLYHAGGACTRLGPGSPPASLPCGRGDIRPLGTFGTEGGGRRRAMGEACEQDRI